MENDDVPLGDKYGLHRNNTSDSNSDMFVRFCKIIDKQTNRALGIFDNVHQLASLCRVRVLLHGMGLLRLKPHLFLSILEST